MTEQKQAVVIKPSVTLMERLLQVGYPPKHFFHHESDLYIYKTPVTTATINEWFKLQGLNKSLFVKEFAEQGTGRPMYDIAFQYTPYWDRVAEKGGQKHD